ncbi:MAG: BatA domain-containing protein [Candidatus Eisenbacteria sp.]|nr:BatA domain-containing protein [Candidatus Eisenbacteria bacterium]
MGGLSFLNGAFLVALAAAALPILIHLLSRRRAREVPFSHLAFLDEITRRKVRRMRLRQWLLLALRTLAIVAIALALSRPVWHGAGGGSRRGSSTVAILIDDSYSMEARVTGGMLPVDAEGAGLDLPTRFDEARQRAREAIELLEEGDRAVLVFMAGPVEVPYESTVRDPALLIEELERARPRPARADFPGALERVYPILAGARTLNREILVISDFQQSQAAELLHSFGAELQPGALGDSAAVPGSAGIPPAAGVGRNAGVRRDAGVARDEGGAPAEGVEGNEGIGLADVTGSSEPAARSLPGGAAPANAAPSRPLLPIPAQTRLYLLPVGTAATMNHSIAGARYESDPGGQGGRLAVRLRNWSDRPVEEVMVQALGGEERGMLLGEGFLKLEPHALGQAVISVPEVPPEGMLTIRAAPDLLERDDVRYLLTTATSRFDVLLVTGESLDQAEIKEEARYAILALDPYHGGELVDGEPGVRSGVRSVGPDEAVGSDAASALFDIETVAEADLGLIGTIDADVVFLLNVGRLSATAVELLDRFQREGGGIMIALGDRVDPRMYNSQILPRLGSLRLENIAGEDQGWQRFTLRPAVVGHAIFDGFPIAPGGALTGARFQRIIEVRTGESSRVLAEFSGGRPALVEEPGLLLFASSLDMRWSDFPTSASYLPFLHRALLHLTLGSDLGRGEPLVGEPLSWPLPRDGAGEAYRCLGPGGLEMPLRVTETDRGPVLRSDPVPEPGFYRPVATGAAGSPTLPIVAVNVDMRESDLQSMSVEQGALLFGSEAIRLAPGDEITRQILEARYGRELWRLCLLFAFLFLVAESLIGRGRSLS